MNKLSVSDVKAFLSKMNSVAVEKKDYLIDLDSKMGDGDLGLTMAAVFAAVDEFAAGWTEDDLGSMLMKGGMAMSKAAPSTMGTLMATGFMRGGKALKGCTEMGTAEAASFWQAFVGGIMDRGKSKPGEKTIIDSLHPAAEALEAAAAAGEDLSVAAVKAKKAAEEGRDATVGMVAQHGRAAYYQEKSADIMDPGATMGAILIGTFADFVAA
ncbi:MAG: dihydroxyacetone kinase subunit L [Spirochaetales bacterium]|uniref:Dihydroxyacetone kinase subunit L n=1 Tax=Candidatus Thalassospirochaeta sargassi TaxID=3119039 RepID=A0AAJ1IEF6_9SPIO|nr:dihydroxyacetone kinase subunit L [Spirochaetales bacterium]